MNAIDYAIRIDAEGEHLFERLELEESNPEMKGLFGLLRKEERDHIVALEKIRSDFVSDVAVPKIPDKVAGRKSGLKRLLGKGHSEMKMDHDGFWHLITAEEESIRTLEGMVTTEPGKETKKLLMTLVAEEKRHLTRMEEIYDFIEKPRTYLEWGEFSNLRPL